MELQWNLALIGGAMVGVGGCLFLLVNGRVLGTSGIVGGLVDGSGHANRNERVAFLIGLIGIPGVMALLLGAPDTHVTDQSVVLIASGLLTGVGTRLANGCTSGHAISGVSRFSARSMIATVSYVGAGVLTVVIARHAWGAI